MMTQEEFMDVMAMKRQGMSIKEIAEETGYHPSTISGWLRNGGPPARRPRTSPPVIDDHWGGEIAALLRAAPRLLATSVFELIRAKGYEGSYVSVARHLNTLRGPRFASAPAASTRIVTAPGEEAQFDWSDVSHWTREWGLGEVQCFSAILSFSRMRIWWFARSVDREHTFEGLVRFFEFVGGVPKVLRTDRMGALGTSQGRRFRLHPPTHGFAQFCGTEIRTCQARDAKRKGKVERPFRDVKERFLEECAATGAPSSLSELNERAARWLEQRVHARRHRGTGAIPAERLAAEVPLLAALPRRRFDTAYVEARRVHVAIPQIEWRGVRYSVPPRCLGQRVEVRQEVEGSSIEIRWAAEVVATHAICDTEGMEVWDALHFQEAQTAALSRSRGRHLSIVVPDEVAPTAVPLRLDIAGDVDIDVPDLARYETDEARS
jgi:transposase